jgi:hypothetical protein
MTQRDNILQELRELQSSLVNAASQNIYRVPAGYFEGLADQVLRRIKALEAESASEELVLLSPLVNSISKKMPYSVPSGFFEGLTESIIGSVKTDHQTPAEELGELSPLLSSISKQTPYSVPAGFFDGLAERAMVSLENEDQTPAEELETLSPLLSGLKKEMPYGVPQGYFEGLNNTVTIKPVAVVKIVSITRQNWFRFAAAAVVIGFVALTGFFIFNKQNPIDPKEKSFAWVEKNVKKVSTDDINDFVQLAEEAAPVMASIDIKTANEIKDLIKDIPEKEIQDFLDETQSGVAEENNDDMFMN